MVISVAIHILQRLLHLDSNIFFESLFLWLIGFKYIGTFPDSFLRGAIQIGVVEHAVLSYWFFGRRISLLFACVGFCLWGIYLFIFLVRVISFFKYINCLISSNIWIFFNFFLYIMEQAINSSEATVWLHHHCLYHFPDRMLFFALYPKELDRGIITRLPSIFRYMLRYNCIFLH